MTTPAKREGDVYVPVTINGSEVLALLDTGSARTLLDANSFRPSTLARFTNVTAEEDELLDASGNRVPTVGKWPARVHAAGFGGCIAADVVRGCPTKAVLGLDALRILSAVIVFADSDVEMRIGGWRMQRGNVNDCS